jgi:hypothetical protein
MRKRKRKRRTGNNLLAAAVCAVLSFFSTPASARAANQPALKQYALIAGTVFEESGLSLRGAELLLVPDPQDAKKHKLKKSEAISDSRGEFAFRVPALPSRYTMKVKRKGFIAQEKAVEVKGDERVDLNFRLEPAR